MFKAAGKTGAGVPLLLLGLSRENIRRLQAGQPIWVHAAEMASLGMPEIEVALHYGRTEEAIVAELEAGGITMRPNT